MSEEDKTLDAFASKALRGPKKGALDQALSWYFFKALQAKPLDKIIKTREILGMLTDDQLKIIEADPEKFETYCVLAHAIENPGTLTEGCYGKAFMINWPFPHNTETWNRYFEPWSPDNLTLPYYPHLMDLSPQIMQELETAKRTSYFLVITTRGLSEGAYQSVKNRFIKWAFPDVMRVLSRIATLIEPSQFLEAVDLDPNQKREAVEP